MTRQLSELISTVTAAPVVRFLSLSSIPRSERHRRCCSQRFFPELAEVSLVEHFSIRISRHRPDFERITVAASEKPVRGSDGLLLFLLNMCIIVDRPVGYDTYQCIDASSGFLSWLRSELRSGPKLISRPVARTERPFSSTTRPADETIATLGQRRPVNPWRRRKAGALEPRHNASPALAEDRSAAPYQGTLSCTAVLFCAALSTAEDAYLSDIPQPALQRVVYLAAVRSRTS